MMLDVIWRGAPLRGKDREMSPLGMFTQVTDNWGFVTQSVSKEAKDAKEG